MKNFSYLNCHIISKPFFLQIKGNEYKVLASEGEEHLGGEDFNQRLFDYVIKEIKKDSRFKNINLEKKDYIIY